MKNVLNHMTSCQAGKSCPVPHCSSSRQIIAHWKHCNRQDCPVCLPLKQSDHSRGRQQPGCAANGPGGPGGNGGGPGANMLPNQPGQQQQQNVNASQANNGSQNSLPMLLSPQNNAQQPQQQQQQQGNNQQIPVSSASGPNPSPVSDESMKKAYAALGLPPSGQFQPQQPQGVRPRMPGPGGNNQGQQQPGQQPGQMRMSVPNAPGGPFRPNMGGPTSSPSQLALELMEGQGEPVRLPNNLPIVSATPMPSVKEWHGAVTSDLRNHLVHKL